MPNSNGDPTEAETQSMLFRWASYNPELRCMFAIPNGGSRHKLEAINLKFQGVKAGVPDIFLPLPKGKYHGLFIELKVGKNKTSTSQNEWIERLKKAGYMSEVCYGFDNAKETIEKYLKEE